MDVSKLGHRSHISGKGRWLKSKLAHRRAERLVKQLRKINGKNHRNHKREVIGHEEILGI